jgi:hypothetical protein
MRVNVEVLAVAYNLAQREAILNGIATELEVRGFELSEETSDSGRTDIHDLEYGVISTAPERPASNPIDWERILDEIAVVVTTRNQAPCEVYVDAYDLDEPTYYRDGSSEAFASAEATEDRAKQVYQRVAAAQSLR